MMFLGMGKLRMDLRYCGQGLTLSGSIWNPANSAVSLAKMNLLVLRMIPLWPKCGTSSLPVRNFPQCCGTIGGCYQH